MVINNFVLQYGQGTFPVTITYPIAFLDTNYAITISSNSKWYENVYTDSKTTTTFYCGADKYDGSRKHFDYIACGRWV